MTRVNGSLHAVVGARVQLGSIWVGVTDDAGFVQSPAVPAGTYVRTVTATGFISESRIVTVVAGQNVHAGAILKAEPLPR